MFCPSVSTLSLGPPTKWRGNTNGSVEIMRTRHVDVDVDVDLPPGVVAGLHTAPLHPSDHLHPPFPSGSQRQTLDEACVL